MIHIYIYMMVLRVIPSSLVLISSACSSNTDCHATLPRGFSMENFLGGRGAGGGVVATVSYYKRLRD